MKNEALGRIFGFALLPVFFAGMASSQDLKTIPLNAPDKNRGLPFMQTLSVRASATEWSDRELSLQDLSDLLWAANGINRPDSGKRTASSAMNAQDVDVYVFTKDGVYLYDAKDHALIPVAAGDSRPLVMAPRPAGAPGGQAAKPAADRPPAVPVLLLLVSDIARFRSGSQELKLEWAAIDTGIVSQNISLFCAAVGLATRPRASMDREKIRSLLKLKDTQYPLLNHPIGHGK